VPFFDVVNLTYKAPRYNTFKWRVCYRPDRRRRRYSTFAPFPGYIPPQWGRARTDVLDGLSGHVVGCDLWTTAMASVCRMRGVCVIGSRLQSPQSCWSYVASFQLTHCQDSVLLQPACRRCGKQHERCQHLLQPRSLRPTSISHTLPSLTSSFSCCYVICRRRSLEAQRSPCGDAGGDGSSAGATS